MDNYITGKTIKRLREGKKLTQAQLAAQLCVSDKAVSKWETSRGLPDITLIAQLSAALGVSVAELMSGESVTNRNRSAKMTRSKLYVCPVCGNLVQATGEAAVSCCGIALPPLEAEEPDAEHEITVEKTDGEYFVSMKHEMSREHYVSFLVVLTLDKVVTVKLYPEGSAEARIPVLGPGLICAYCNRHGLFAKKI